MKILENITESNLPVSAAPACPPWAFPQPEEPTLQPVAEVSQPPMGDVVSRPQNEDVVQPPTGDEPAQCLGLLILGPEIALGAPRQIGGSQ